ncbi:MAG: hypothetical protein AAGB04_13220 [Pseudomonadota bacterium]
MRTNQLFSAAGQLQKLKWGVANLRRIPSIQTGGVLTERFFFSQAEIQADR